MKIKLEKSQNKWSFLPEINFTWKKRYYFFVFFSWLKWTINLNFGL